MGVKELGGRIVNQIGLKSKDKVLHILKDKTMFSNLLSTSVGRTGKIFIFNLSNQKQSEKPNISFLKNIEDLKIDPESLDLILLEDVFSKLENKIEGLKYIKKYLSSKGKIAIIEKKDNFILKFLNLDKKSKVTDAMFISSYRLKNEFNFTNKYYLLIYERE